jgi:hypothetical protein
VNTEYPYEFVCVVCAKRTVVEDRGQYNAMDKLEARTGWRIKPRGSYFAKVYCPKHAERGAT